MNLVLISNVLLACTYYLDGIKTFKSWRQSAIHTTCRVHPQKLWKPNLKPGLGITRSVTIFLCYRNHPSVISIFSNFNLIFRQCRWELWGDFGHQSNFESLRKSRMETARNLSFIVWNGRGIFSFWRTNLCYEVWVMDIWWISGTYLCNKKLGSWFSTICVCISFCKVLVGISRNFSN